MLANWWVRVDGEAHYRRFHERGSRIATTANDCATVCCAVFTHHLYSPAIWIRSIRIYQYATLDSPLDRSCVSSVSRLHLYADSWVTTIPVCLVSSEFFATCAVFLRRRRGGSSLSRLCSIVPLALDFLSAPSALSPYYSVLAYFQRLNGKSSLYRSSARSTNSFIRIKFRDIIYVTIDSTV